MSAPSSSTSTTMMIARRPGPHLGLRQQPAEVRRDQVREMPGEEQRDDPGRERRPLRAGSRAPHRRWRRPGWRQSAVVGRVHRSRRQARSLCAARIVQEHRPRCHGSPSRATAAPRRGTIAPRCPLARRRCASCRAAGRSRTGPTRTRYSAPPGPPCETLTAKPCACTRCARRSAFAWLGEAAQLHHPARVPGAAAGGLAAGPGAAGAGAARGARRRGRQLGAAAAGAAGSTGVVARRRRWRCRRAGGICGRAGRQRCRLGRTARGGRRAARAGIVAQLDGVGA